MDELIEGLAGQLIDISAIADRIRKRNQRMVEGVIATGMDLMEVKAMLGHGKFGAWLEKEFSMSERTARHFMSAAEAFSADRKCVADLPLATVYKLAAPSTPNEVRDQVVSDLKSGQVVTPVEIEERIKAAKPVKSFADIKAAQRRKRARRNGSLTPQRADEIDRERQKEQEDFERREREVQDRANEALRIVARLPDQDRRRLLDLIGDHRVANILISAPASRDAMEVANG